ncbi:MAG: hypothetical protein GY790_16760, partial [Bacteroidetes bacterium]|nr:hypothetical protein [Bacteroidota bacterium]
MFGTKYFINPETLRIERVKLSRRQWVQYSLIFGLGVVALAVFLRFGFERFYPTPRQIIYEQENAELRSGYMGMNSYLQQVEFQLSELRIRDDDFYRSILSLDPVASTIRDAGTGGSETYTQLRNVREPGMIRNVSQRIDNIDNRVKIQSSSLE